MDKAEKMKALDAALTQIEKAYGKGSVMKLGDSGANIIWLPDSREEKKKCFLWEWMHYPEKIMDWSR